MSVERRKPVGVVEGFFGPEWSWSARHHFVEAIQCAGGDFYLYAPKRDPYLRKSWSQDHPTEIWRELKALSAKCQNHKVRFGVGLSPFELHDHWNEATKNQLRDKILKLHDLGTEWLGLFFDDMKCTPNLAEKQIEIVDFVRSLTKQTLLFCPTYYSWDSILDRVFGPRPENYLEQIGQGIDRDVRILWTGNKVISDSISAQDIVDMAQILKRDPFVWDNFYANDGPRQCKFLRLRSFAGRTEAALERSSGWALNLMNQASLSEVLFCSSAAVLLHGLNSDISFKRTLGEMTGPSFAELVISNEILFNQIGTDQLDSEQRKVLFRSLQKESRFEIEVIDWLEGKYLVGPECLTD